MHTHTFRYNAAVDRITTLFRIRVIPCACVSVAQQTHTHALTYACILKIRVGPAPLDFLTVFGISRQTPNRVKNLSLAG